MKKESLKFPKSDRVPPTRHPQKATSPIDMKAPVKKTSKTKFPDREEWDFVKKAVPDCDLWSCLMHEYTREAKERGYFDSYFRAKSSGEKLDEFFKIADKCPFGPPLIHFEALGMPYQKLSDKMRGLVDRAGNSVKEKYKSTYSPAHFSSPSRGPDFMLTNAEQISSWMASSSILIQKDSPYDGEFGFYCIDFDSPKETVIAHFREWLENEYEQRNLTPRNAPNDASHAGGLAKINYVRARLKALGIWRLKQGCPSFEEVKQYTASFSKAKDAEICTKSQVWNDADVKVEETLTELFPRLPVD